MIKIEFYNNGFLINGHANASRKGNDIYCAGVSAIVQGALNWFDIDDIEYVISDGYLMLRVNNLTNHNVNLLELLKIQLRSLDNDENRKYIKFLNKKKEL